MIDPAHPADYTDAMTATAHESCSPLTLLDSDW